MAETRNRTGERYEPSNGTEGDCFHERWCANCAKDKEMNGTCHAEGRDAGDDDWCPILGASFMSGGVKEWVFDAKGWPSCTAFVPMGQPEPVPRCEHTPDMFNHHDQDWALPLMEHCLKHREGTNG